MERSESNVITANYEVIRFIEHGSRCRPAMDCVQGELLIYRVRRCPEIEKATLFAWIRQLIIQIEQYHRCRNNQCYRYLNPYSVLVTREEDVLLLDMEAQSNEFVLKNMQKRAMREHFVKPIVHIRENTRITLDLYGYAKTVQFLLASMQVEPALTKWEEHRLAKMIDKCLSEDTKKQYIDLKQVEKELPVIRKGHKKLRRWGIIGGTVLLLGVGAFTYFYRQGDTKEEREQIKTENTKNRKSDMEEGLLQEEKPAEGPTDVLDVTAETIDAMEQYLLRNTAKDNQEVIRQGENLHRELLRCLAAAYDREQSKERALQAYRELCMFENQTEYLENAYVRRIALERELHPEENTAVETGKEAVGRFPASEVIVKEYAEAVCISTEIESEEKSTILQPLAEQFPVIKESENYQKWEAEQQKQVAEDVGMTENDKEQGGDSVQEDGEGQNENAAQASDTEQADNIVQENSVE